MARVDNANYIEKNLALTKDPRAYLVMSFDTANTDTVIFVSHDDVLPAGTISDARLKSYPSTTQSLKPLQFNSSIGNISPVIQDTGQALTTLISTKLTAGFGLRGQRVQIYLGYKGMEPTDYVLYQTQIVESYSYKDGQYNFSCKDIIRTTQKNIFPEVKTTLGADFLVGEILTITLADTSEFNTLYHGAGWDHLDLPGGDNKVGYFQIDDEVCSFRTKTNITTLTTIERGLFGTLEADHVYLVATGGEPTIPNDRQIKVTEFYYFDLPAVKLLYAILTSTLYGDSQPFPWGLGISTSFIATSQFINIGVDIWDTTTDLHDAQIPATFKDLKEVDAKKFIETQILPLIGCFTPILNDGQIGLTRLTRVLADSGSIRTLDASNIVSYGNLKHDLTQVSNNYLIHWNKNVRSGDTTRTNILLDTASQAKHGVSDKIVLTLNGLDGARHTDAFIVQMFNMLRDRYAGPPQLLEVGVFYKENDLDIGDHVTVDADFIRDAVTGLPTNRTFEIQRKQINHQKGIVNLSLFGSSETATPISPTAGTALTDAFYTTDMLAANKLDVALTTTLTGGVLHLDTSGTLIGQATLPGASNNAVYWYDGNVTIDPGVVITITQNIMLLVRGFLQIDGKIDGKGQGLSPIVDFRSGYIGWTRSDIGIITATCALEHASSLQFKGESYGYVRTMPRLALTYDGTNNFSGLSGYQADLRGASGRDGGDVRDFNLNVIHTGGLGTAGGAGLTIIHRGIASGSGGEIDLSGADILPVTVFEIIYSSRATEDTILCGTVPRPIYATTTEGAQGCSGGLNILADGSLVNETDVITNFTANNGSPFDKIGTSLYDLFGIFSAHYSQLKKGETYRIGLSQERIKSVKFAHSNVQFIPANETKTPDLNPIALIPTVLTATEVTNTPQSLNENLASIEINYTAPVDTNFSHTNLYWKYSTDGDTQYQKANSIINTGEVAVIHTMDGRTLDFKAVSVSKLTGQESLNYKTTSITLSNTTGGVNLSSGNFLRSGQSAFDTGIGFSLSNDGGTPRLSIGNSAGNKMTWDGTTFAVTGTITATTGVIGGWQIGATALTSGSAGTTVGLDSGGSNPAIYAGSATPGSAPFRVTNTGALTATNVTLTGSITASSGALGGWSVTATTIENSTSQVILDSANNRIRVQDISGTNHVTMDATGLIGVDNVLGTTVRIYTDGTPPQFSSGVITSTIYNISTSGILRTSTTVGDGSAQSQGVIINDTGIKGFPSASSTPNFTLSSLDGTITAIAGTVGGWSLSANDFKSGSGSTTVGLATAGTHAIYCGNATPASAPFRVTNAGAITSTSGVIGGWNLSSSTLSNGTSIILDATNAAISINNATYGNSGVQIQNNSGTPRFYAGNGADKSIEFDGSNVKLGKDSQLLGSNSYNNDSIYLDGFLTSYKLNEQTAGTGVIVYDGGFLRSQVIASGDSAEAYLQSTVVLTEFTWDKDRRLKGKVQASSTLANVNFLFGTGRSASITPTIRGAWFKFSSDGNLYAIVADGTTATTSSSLITVSSSFQYKLEIIFIAATSVEFIVDGVSKTTITTNIPTGGQGSFNYVSTYTKWAASTGGFSYVGQFAFNQDA